MMSGAFTFSDMPIEEYHARDEFSFSQIKYMPDDPLTFGGRYVTKTLKIPMEKWYLTLHKYGNISSASCAIAFDEAVRDGSIQNDQLVCLPVFGGGLTWGSALIRW